MGKNCAGNDAKSGYWQAGGKSSQPGSCIYLDRETTTLEIAPASDSHGVTDCGHKRFRYCNYLLDNSNCTIIHTGGAVSGKPFPVSGGSRCETMLRSLMINQAFISASSSSVRGISTPAEVETRR
ncbi:hypothetical protein ACLK1S_16905 [Escherichia coli]